MSSANSTTIIGDITITHTRIASRDTAYIDDILITQFDDHGTHITRIAAFDAAENFAQPDSTRQAQHAIAITRKWFATEVDPIVALTGANNELWHHNRHSPQQPSSTTVVYADITTHGHQLHIVSAGICADGNILTRTGHHWKHHPAQPMLPAELYDPWAATYAQLAGTTRNGHEWPALRWQQRPHHITPDDWTNPPIGATHSLNPTIYTEIGPIDELVIATDGAELDNHPLRTFNLHTHLQQLQQRTPRHPGWAPTGDIAAAAITPTITNPVEHTTRQALQHALDPNAHSNAVGVTHIVNQHLNNLATTQPEHEPKIRELQTLINDAGAHFERDHTNAVGAADIIEQLLTNTH